MRNGLPTNDAYMHHETITIYMGDLILGVTTLYRFFCFFKLFPLVGKRLRQQCNKPYHFRSVMRQRLLERFQDAWHLVSQLSKPVDLRFGRMVNYVDSCNLAT